MHKVRIVAFFAVPSSYNRCKHTLKVSWPAEISYSYIILMLLQREGSMFTLTFHHNQIDGPIQPPTGESEAALVSPAIFKLDFGYVSWRTGTSATLGDGLL